MIWLKKIVITVAFGILSVFLLGILAGQQLLLHHQKYISSTIQNKGTALESVSADFQLLELHVFKEELLLDIPIPAFRFQIKFRTQQEIDTKIRVEMQFKGALKNALGEVADAVTCEGMEEHFGWFVYTYGFTIGGDSLAPSLLDAVAQDPHSYVSVSIAPQ